MRREPTGAAIVVKLRSLKMYDTVQAAGDLMEQGIPAFDSALPSLSQLPKAETAEREVRSVAYKIKAAGFSEYKDLSGFNFSSSEANEALVRRLHCCEFIENADNAALVGGPSTGKSHIATALGVQAVDTPSQENPVRRDVDPVNAMEREKPRARSGQIADRLMRCDLVILEELGIGRSAPPAGCCFSIC